MENVEIRHLLLLQDKVGRVMRLRLDQYSKVDVLKGKIREHWNPQSCTLA